MMNPLIPAIIVIPLFSAFLIMATGGLVKNLAKNLTPAIMLILLIINGISFSKTGTGTQIYKIGGWEATHNIPIGIYLVMDGLTVIILFIIALLGFVSSLYSISYIRKYTAENNFYALVCLMIAGMNGVALSGDIFNLYVFLEISVISSYALVAFGVEKHELEASFKYQVLGGIASLVILLGIAFVYWRTGTLNIADIHQVLKNGQDDGYSIFLQVLLLTGFGLKAAIMPFHAWLPDAHSSAPSPISAMLSGVLIKAAGIYVIMRIFFNLFVATQEIATVITVLGTLSMVAGVFLAYGQWDIKRLLAYHSISQMGYVVMSSGIALILISRDGNREIAALALAGGLYHMINHAVFKGLLFLNAGAIEHRLGTRNLKEMGGLSSTMPVTSATSFIASMAISGIPPFNGFFSKLIIIIAAVKGEFYLLAFLAVFVSIITLASFLKFQRYAFQNKKPVSPSNLEVPFSMTCSMIILGILCLGLSLLVLPGIREAVLDPAVQLMLDSGNYSITILGL